MKFFKIVAKSIAESVLFAISKSPRPFIEFFTTIAYFIGGKFAYKILINVNLKKLIILNLYFVKKYYVVDESQIKSLKVVILDEARYEKMRTPDVYGVMINNSFTLYKHEIAIYRFQNAKFRAKSDIIKIQENAYFEKVDRPEYALTIPVDSDFINFDPLSRILIAFEEKKIRKFEIGFNLCGVHTNTWAHFIISYLPKLLALNKIKVGSNFALFVPRNILENNKDLINLAIENILQDKDVELIFVDDDETIECSVLYYCNAVGYLCDHSTYIHPAGTCISEYGAKAIHQFSSSLWKSIKSTPQRKIYIGRGKGRNLFNATQVENYFIQNGFEIVHPHLMTLKEKIDVFGNASHICGPASSGFANFIFAKNKVKILAFFNFARCFDPFLSGIIYGGEFKHDLLVLTGHEEVNTNVNNSYYIELEKIVACCNETDYFN